mgnify:CR=1 FL=1
MRCLHYPYFSSDVLLISIYFFTLSVGEKIHSWFLLLSCEGSQHHHYDTLWHHLEGLLHRALSLHHTALLSSHVAPVAPFMGTEHHAVLSVQVKYRDPKVSHFINF